MITVIMSKCLHIHISLNNLEEDIEVKFCGKCGAKLTEGDAFCTHCGARINDYRPEYEKTQQDIKHNENINSSTPQQCTYSNTQTENQNTPPQRSEEKINIVNIKGATYVGKKWFIKLAYKMYETDVDFYNTFMSCKQGTGFSKVRTKIQIDFKYEDIYAIDAKKKYSIPNIVFAVIVDIMAFATQVWAALIISLIVFFIGKTAVVVIHNSRGTYEIPTEFMSDAEELRNKIIAAQNQALRK